MSGWWWWWGNIFINPLMFHETNYFFDKNGFEIYVDLDCKNMNSSGK